MLLYLLNVPDRFRSNYERITFLVFLIVLATGMTFWVGLLTPPLAHAADSVPPDSRTLFLPQTQLLVAIVGSLVPFFTYMLNFRAGWVSEPAKAVVLALVAAAAGVLTTLIDTGGIPVNWDTAQLVGTAVALAFLSHIGFWRPSGISTVVGGGRNKQDE